MGDRDQLSRLEMYFATALLVFSSGVAYGAFLPEPAGHAFVKAGESVVYSSLWAGGYLVMALLVGLRFRGVLTVFASNWPILVLLFAYLLPEIREPNSLLRLLLLLCTVTFSAWMASRFSLTQMITTLHYVFGLMMVVHAMSAFVNTSGYQVDALERESLPGFAIYAGLFSHKQQAGIMFSLSFIFYSLLLILTSRSTLRNILGASTSLLFLLLSGSANALLTTVVTLYVSLCLWALIKNQIYVFYIGISTSIVIAAPLIVDSDRLFGALGRTSDLTGRTVLWEHWPGFFYDRLLIGYGYSGFFVQGGPAERLWALDNFQTPNFHNAFLDVGIQAGLVGLLSLLLIVLIGIVRTYRGAYTYRQPSALLCFALYLDLWLFGSGEGILITHNNFLTICAFTIYFRSGIELHSRATSRFLTAFDKRHGPAVVPSRVIAT